MTNRVEICQNEFRLRRHRMTKKGACMNIYIKIKTTLFFLLFGVFFSGTLPLHAVLHEIDQLDSMVDFAYPVSAMQLVRQDLNQALYFSQHNNFETAENFLQQAISKFSLRKSIEQEDREYIQEIINQIDALINSLEHTDRSLAILDVCQQFQDRL